MSFHAVGDGLSDLKFYLSYNDGENIEVLNRYLAAQGEAGSPFSATDNDDGFFSQEITPGEIQSDLDILFAQDYGDVVLPPAGRYSGVAAALGLFTAAGVPFVQPGFAPARLDPLRPDLSRPQYVCVYAENTISMVGACLNRSNPDSHSPWSLPNTLITQVRAQVRLEPGASGCLYDVAVAVCTGGDENVRTNIRRVDAGASGVIEIPLPGLGIRTYFDEFCDA